MPQEDWAFKIEKKRTSHSNVPKSLNKLRKEPWGTVMSDQDQILKPATHQSNILDVKICDQAKGRIPTTRKNTGKKHISTHRFLLVYYLSDSEMGYNYGVTFPTANMFQCKQLTPVLLAGLKRLLRDCGKLQCPMNNK